MDELSSLETELKKVLQYIDPQWKMQNNFYDYQTNFIYSTNTVQECIDLAKINNTDISYTLHRWYNYKTSIQCENIFVEYGAMKEQDLKNKEIDIYIINEGFDVKLTVYPNALNSHPYNLKSREGKNEMIKWLYKHQSQQQRKHLKNRIFIVCDGKTQYDSLCLKSDFIQIRKKIKAYLEDVKNNGFNQITIYDQGKSYTVKSDIIYITNEK